MADFAELGLRFVPVNDAAAVKALKDVEAGSDRVEIASKKLTATQQSAANTQKALSESHRLQAGTLGSLTTAMAAAGATAAAAAIALTRLKDASLQYAASMREISTLVNTATFDVNALSKAAIAQAGAFNSQPITQTKALYQIISAGASSAAQATDTLTAANKLAVGGVTTVAIAADGLTSVLNAYGDKVSGATAVSDAMFIAMKGGKTTIAELSASLGTVAPLAASTGVSFDELTAATAALTKGGISTNESITGLRAILAAVAKPSSEAAKLAAQLGLEFNSTALASKGLAGFLADLQAKTGGNTDALATLFGGVEALVPVMALSGQAGKDFTVILDQMAGKTGATQEAFDKIASGAAFQLGRIFATITSNAIGLAAALAERAAPGLKVVADNLDLVAKAGAVVAVVIGTNALVSFASFAASAISASVAVRAYVLSVALVGPVSATASAMTVGLGMAMRGLLAAATSATAVLSALFIGLGAIALASAKAAAQVQSLDAATERARTAIDGYAASTREAAATSGAVGTSAAGAVGSIDAAGNAAGIAADKFWHMAAAAKSAAVAANFKQIADLQGEIDRTEALTRGSKAGQGSGRRRIDSSTIASTFSGGVNLLAGDIKSFLTGGDSDRALESSLAGARKQMEGLVAVGRQLLAQDFETPLRAQAASHTAVATSTETATQAARAAKDTTDEFADSVKAFNEAAAERNRLAEQFAAFTPKTVDDPILVATAGKSAFDADALNRYADQVDQVARHTQTAAQGMAEAFGGVGKAVGDLVTVLSNYDARQADIAARRADERARYDAALADQTKRGAGWAKAELDWTHAQEMAARESAQARIQHYGDMAHAAQGFFKEGTIGYSVMGAAEKAFRLIEFAMSAKSIAVKAFETAAKIGLFGAEATAAAGAGAAAIFAAMGPFGFPVVAAMVATLAGLGVALSGGGGGGAVPGANDMANRQASQGTGSVLGDASAQSASLQNSMKIAEANWNKDLEYSNGMLKALRSIDGNMGALAASIARTLGTGGALSTDSLGLGTTGRPATLGNLGFGNTTTKTLQDQGLSFGAQNIGDILASGIQGETFQQTLSTTIKKAFGITYSNKSSTTTTTAALDADLSRQITDVIKSLRAGVLSAAGILGVTGAEATLDAFTVSLGKLSFKDMKGDEIQAALNAIFGKLGDDLAATAIPALTDLQKVGEGAFETLVRVARQYQVVDTSLQSIGMAFGAVGVASLAARERLVDLSGGLDAFTEGTSFFAENFLSEAERLAPVQKAVTAELARLGLAVDLTRDQFKSVVLGLDLTSEAGASMYAALINLAPAFDKVATAAEAAAEIAAEATADLTKAYEVLFAGQIEQAARVAEIATYDRRARYAEQAADRDRALKATEAATEAQAKLAETSMAAAKAALLAGDGLSALSGHMKVSADLARLAQQTNAAGSFNAGNFNAAYAGIQSRAALPLMQEASLNALRLENATKAVRDLMGVYLAPRSRELGGQTVGPVGDGLGIASIMARQGEALASFTALQDQWFAGIIKGQEATDLFAEAAEDAGAAITRAGLDSLGLYFRDITSATAELNAQAALAAEPISQVAQAIGRLNSIADVFTMSANAALGAGLTPDVEKAALIAQSAAIASQAMITADAAKIAEKIAGEAAFGALSKAGIRDAAMLLDGLKGNDARSFEAAFLRINNALVTGAVNQEQYQVLFGAAINTFEGLDEKVAATAQTFADLRLSAQKLAADLRMDASINPAGAAGAFAASQDRYEGLFSSVLGGNVGAFSDFASTAQAMLSNAKSTFATGLEYDRLFGRTLGDVDQLANLPTPQVHEDRMESLAAENNAELKALKATVQALLEEQQRSNRSQNQNGRIQTETLRQTVAPDSGTA